MCEGRGLAAPPCFVLSHISLFFSFPPLWQHGARRRRLRRPRPRGTDGGKEAGFCCVRYMMRKSPPPPFAGKPHLCAPEQKEKPPPLPHPILLCFSLFSPNSSLYCDSHHKRISLPPTLFKPLFRLLQEEYHCFAFLLSNSTWSNRKNLLRRGPSTLLLSQPNLFSKIVLPR